MARVKEILLSAGSGSLVLLDELGAGTDPEEGSALALAILDELIVRGAHVLVTSHHGALKNYAFTHAQCINASVEFDSQNLLPAYRVIQGVPGKSAAIEIAHNSGIPQAVIERAKTYLQDGHADMSLLIQELTKKNEQARCLTENLQAQSDALNKDAQKIAQREARLKQKEIEIAELALLHKKDFADESRKLLENLVRELREGEITREKTLAVKQFILELDQQNARDAENLAAQKAELQDTMQTERDAQNAPHEILFEPREGDSVWVYSLKKEGRVIQKASQKKGGSKSAWITQVGSVKLSIAQSDMKPLAHSTRGVSTALYYEDAKDARRLSDFCNDNTPSFMNETPQYELRVLGMRQEEAIKALQKQIDLASVNALSQFCVIHGKGNGVLQKAVHEYLSHESRVGEFYFARPEDGGTGKTYIRLA